MTAKPVEWVNPEKEMHGPRHENTGRNALGEKLQHAAKQRKHVHAQSVPPATP